MGRKEGQEQDISLEELKWERYQKKMEEKLEEIVEFKEF